MKSSTVQLTHISMFNPIAACAIRAIDSSMAHVSTSTVAPTLMTTMDCVSASLGII